MTLHNTCYRTQDSSPTFLRGAAVVGIAGTVILVLRVPPWGSALFVSAPNRPLAVVWLPEETALLALETAKLFRCVRSHPEQLALSDIPLSTQISAPDPTDLTGP